MLMAKRSHASKRAPARRKRRSPSPMVFTSELLADARRRYEQTSEPLYLIAADLGIHRSTFSVFALREGWVRHRPAPRELSAASRLLKQTEKLEAESLALWHAPAAKDDGQESAIPGPACLAGPADMTASIEWLHREVRGQIAAVEALRARMRGTPQTGHEAAVIARTLVALTGALHKLQRMACGVQQPGSDHDDFPTNIDELRDELARRIEAFMESRPDTDFDGDAAAAPAGEPR
jgi:hypothetical protein